MPRAHGSCARGPAHAQTLVWRGLQPRARGPGVWASRLPGSGPNTDPFEVMACSGILMGGYGRRDGAP